jgi:hypothetical protein
MAIAVYALCSITSTLCAGMLYRKYRIVPVPLLLWSSICFIGLAINNILLFVDMVVLPYSVDLSVLRTIPALLGISALLYGFVREQS